MLDSGTAGARTADIGKIIKTARHYYVSTGIRTVVINTGGEDHPDSCRDNPACGFCRKAQNLLGERLDCRKAHLYGSYQAERFGGKYIFFCPLGLTHWVSPIACDGMVQYSMLAGPVQMVEPDDFLMDEMIRKHIADESRIKELEEYLESIPVIRPDRVDSLSELLLTVALQLSAPQNSQYEEIRENVEQQSDISEYIHHLKAADGEARKYPGYPLDKEKELLPLIAMGDKPGAQRVLNEIFGYVFFSTGGDFEIIKARVLELTVLLSRAALEGGADAEQIFGLNYRYLSEINNIKTVEDLTWWLSRIMGRFTDCVFNLVNVKHADVIYKAVDYIKRNYMKKLSLEEVASHVYLSPSYFSKIFKSEMGCNFITYLNQMRIKVSKNLLLDDKIDLVEVSNIVGYEDQSYFSKTFKKLAGVTPGRYRECRGQIKPEPNELLS